MKKQMVIDDEIIKKVKSKKEDCKVFAFLGSVLGLFVPTFLFLIYILATKKTSLYGELVIGLLIVLIILSFLPILYHLLYDVYPHRHKRYDYELYVIGSLTVIVTAITVYFTGGMEVSLLSFYFLFIPSAIAISFEANISLKLVCSIGCISVIYLFLFAPNNNTLNQDVIYKIFYCLIIIIQFISIYFLEKESKSRRYEIK